MKKNTLDFNGLNYLQSSSCIPGVIDYFAEDARLLRQIIRKMEDVLDTHGFDQLFFGMLGKHDIFVRNLDSLGSRFMENLIYSNVNGETNVVVLPEGTMKTYDFICINKMKQARIFYSTMFARNEPLEDVDIGKTRNFWQIGFEIFNYPLCESSVEVVEIANEMIQAVGLTGVVFRLTDKRLIKGYIARYEQREQDIVQSVMDLANDDPIKFQTLYRQAGGLNKMVEKEVCSFMALVAKTDLTIDDLKSYSYGNAFFLEGLNNLSEIINALKDVKWQLVPFMAKSWDAGWGFMFDGRYPGYDAAICGGDDFYHNKYLSKCSKLGVGIGVTRIFDILKKNY